VDSRGRRERALNHVDGVRCVGSLVTQRESVLSACGFSACSLSQRVLSAISLAHITHVEGFVSQLMLAYPRRCQSSVQTHSAANP
jgi:hypothetical protein